MNEITNEITNVNIAPALDGVALLAVHALTLRRAATRGEAVTVAPGDALPLVDAIDAVLVQIASERTPAHMPAPEPMPDLPPRDYPALRAWRRVRPRDWKDSCHRDPLWHAAVLELHAREWDAQARAMASVSRHSAEAARRQADHYLTQAADVLATSPERTHVAA